MYLRSNGVTYHLIDESILSRHGDNQGEALVVGKCRYTTVLIPEIRNISKETYGLLTKYSGKLCVLGNLQFINGNKQKIELQSNITLEQIIEREKIKFRCADGNSFITERKGDIGDFLFIKNNSMTEESHVSLENIAEKYCKLDIETLREECIDNEITLEPAQSFVLIKSKSAHVKVEKNQKKDITDRFRVMHISENYLVLDYVQYRVGGGKFSKSLPIPMVFEKLLRQGYKGKLEIKQTFFLKDTIPLTLMMEQARYKSVSLNGKLLTFTKSSFDINFIESVLDEYICIGKNELVYSLDFWQHEGVQFALFNPLATESLRNCLYYDTSIDNTYLKGDFVVNTDMSLSKRKEFPPITNCLNKYGYPFFMGTLSLEGEFEWDGDNEIILGIEGNYLVSRIAVNGKLAEFILKKEKNITHLLKKNNKIEITLCSSLRNLFGPLHFQYETEPKGVSPYNFNFLGKWGEKGAVPKDYTHEYNSVPFGISEIYIKK